MDYEKIINEVEIDMELIERAVNSNCKNPYSKDFDNEAQDEWVKLIKALYKTGNYEKAEDDLIAIIKEVAITPEYAELVIDDCLN